MADLVYRRSAPPFPFGGVARDVPRAFLLYAGVDPLNLGGHERLGYLLVVTPFDATRTLDLPVPPLAFGAVDRRRPRHITIQGRTATIYPAATGNASRSTANDDVPAAMWVPGKLSGAFNYEISLFAGDDPTKGGGATLGILELEDPDGELDYLRALSLDSAPLEIRRGDPDAYFAAYRAVARLTTAGIRATTRKKEIVLRDLAWKLMQAELHGERYTGAGGLEGDANLKGVIKPIAFGPVFGITPKLIDAARQIYQVSCTSVLAIAAVFDGASPLTFHVDYATYAELESAVVPAGQFATCLAVGVFKIETRPTYIITADVRGDNDSINTLTYPHTRAQIARRIATGRGNVRLRDPQDIDGPAFEYLAQWQPANVGRFWDREITKAEALTELMAGCAGWWTVRLDGRLAIGQLEDPAGMAALFTLDYEPTDTESRLDPPEAPEQQTPRRSTLMGWRRNYTPLATNQIAGTVSQADAAIAQAEGRFTTSESLWVAAGYPSAPVVTVDGGFEFEADAQNEGDREMRLFAKMRGPYNVPVVMDPFADVVGRVARILNANRLGLGTSRNLFCFGVAVNANAKPILQLWG